uniref:DNA/RNA-binding protein KIN17 n=1 Tax=Cacopsylla melanoneura TaxID=428564 RepID=A0A8D8YUS0_9HEMI
MGKHEVGTPKYIANKMKAKGLQKLRWYCQMCQKQCRDENGFKCHTSSEAHQRQLLLFADNADQYLDEFSLEFEEGYLEMLRRSFGTKRVFANKVYQDYIADREHVHMNATQWETLTEFVKHLGKGGKCIVDETEKGWFVTYIDRDPETIAFQQAMAKKEKMEQDDAERNMKFLEHQIMLGKQKAAQSEPKEPVSNELIRNEDEKLTLKLDTFKKPSSSNMGLKKINLEKDLPEASSSSSSSKKHSSEKRKLTALEQIKLEEEDAKKRRVDKERQERGDSSWLQKNIIVKIVTKNLGEKFYKKKGVVEKVIDKYAAVVSLLDSKHKIKLDQEHLETVIPNIDRQVLILRGKYKGEKALMKEVNIDECNADVELLINKKMVRNIDYSDICKIFE